MAALFIRSGVRGCGSVRFLPSLLSVSRRLGACKIRSRLQGDGFDDDFFRRSFTAGIGWSSGDDVSIPYPFDDFSENRISLIKIRYAFQRNKELTVRCVLRLFLAHTHAATHASGANN